MRELATHAVLDEAAAGVAERALRALQAFEARTRAKNAACNAAVIEAKRCYFATVEACRGLSPSTLAGMGRNDTSAVERRFVTETRDCRTVDQVVSCLVEQATDHVGWGEPYLTPSIEWRTALLRRNYGCDIDRLPSDVGESLFALQEHCRRVGQRLLSSDFLSRLAWMRRLDRVLAFPPQAFTVLEMGGGFGALSRMFKLIHPQSRLVLVDTPEGLFYQQAFLQASFSDLQHQYVTGPNDVVSDADFIYVPAAFANVIERHEIFLAISANPLGRFSRDRASHWLELAQNRTTAAHVFVLDAFLNRIGKDGLEASAREPSWSFTLDDRWSIRDWEVDPDYERCPYFQTTQERRLHLIASRDATPGAEAEALKDRAENLELEDWSQRPGLRELRLVTGAEYPPARSRAHLDLAPDLGKTGTLYALWSLVRLCPDRRWLAMLIGYLDYLNGQQTDLFFEEIPMLVAMHARQP